MKRKLGKKEGEEQGGGGKRMRAEENEFDKPLFWVKLYQESQAKVKEKLHERSFERYADKRRGLLELLESDVSSSCTLTQDQVVNFALIKEARNKLVHS